MEKDVRWVQRLSNYEKSLKNLWEAIDLSKERELSKLEKQGVVQVFEIVYELAWNTIKDFYKSQGEAEIQGSRDAFKMAFNRGLIEDGALFMQMIASRQQTIHAYNEDLAERIYNDIVSKYGEAFKQLEIRLGQKNEVRIMNYGLSEEVINQLQNIFPEYSLIDKVVIYGSRAKGNYRKGSDIDLTFFGKDLDLDLIYKIDNDIEELSLPYLFDISVFSQIDNKDLVCHIHQVGKVFYEKK